MLPACTFRLKWVCFVPFDFVHQGTSLPSAALFSDLAAMMRSFRTRHFQVFPTRDLASTSHLTPRADESVNWSHVQHTRLLADAPVKCPLCLGETICPRITECGHVYAPISHSTGILHQHDGTFRADTARFACCRCSLQTPNTKWRARFVSSPFT
jgi:hypothetical protein